MRYSVTPHPIETILTWIKSGEIAIPEIQRPFVWDSTKVRNLLDSLYQGYPVGYLIAWKNPGVRLKDGSYSAGKRILIDGQQRVTALMAALLGFSVVNRDYQKVKIRIAFHPLEMKFEVYTPFIGKDPAWISDVSEVFVSNASLFSIVKDFCQRNPDADHDLVARSIERLRHIVSNQVGIIELAPDLDIDTVTEIFIRVNSAGAALSQADFAMSKIATNEQYNGSTLRKAIDYFCHLAVSPEFFEAVKNGDPEFASTDYFQAMSWLRHEIDDIYDPSYTDMLRVAFTSEFRRGRLQDLVALLSGRNFETKQYEAAVAEASFERLGRSVRRFISETNFKKFVMIIRSAGFVDSSLIQSQNSLNFGYILYLTLKDQKMAPADIESAVRRWFVMSVLTSRYSGSPESTMDYDIRQIEQHGFDSYGSAQLAGTLSESYWRSLLPQEMATSSASSPYFKVFQAAQIKLQDKGFLSRDITVLDLILNKSDVHHVFPKAHLKKQGATRARYNQIANYVLAQSEINIAISDTPPEVYFDSLVEQCNGGKRRYGAITSLAELRTNLRMNALPLELLEPQKPDYDDFLTLRRGLMAEKIRDYFSIL